MVQETRFTYCKETKRLQSVENAIWTNSTVIEETQDAVNYKKYSIMESTKVYSILQKEDEDFKIIMILSKLNKEEE